MRFGLSVLSALLLTTFGVADPPASEAAVRKLIRDLDHPRYQVREAAQRELTRLGQPVVPALRQALKDPPSAEAAERLRQLLAALGPLTIDAHGPGWHWVYGTIAHAQSFEATGAEVTAVRLRVAQLNANRPAGPLEVEIRDPKLQTIFVRGTISPKVLGRDFRWQPVTITHTAPLTPGQKYALLMHSQDTRNTGPWVVNAIYQDVYPSGQQWALAHEDFFFELEFKSARGVRVGPAGDNTSLATPINSGADGGEMPKGPLTLQGFGVVPEGKLAGPK